MAGRLLFRAFVADATGGDAGGLAPVYECPECGTGEHGAPGFAVATSDDGGLRLVRAAVSMSRAGGWALFGFEAITDDGGPVSLGVDLALVADFRRAIPQAAYSADESLRLSRSDDVPAEAARLWTRKEALLKATRTGLRTDPASVETAEDPRVVDLDPSSLGLPPGFVAAAALVELRASLR